MTPRNIRQTDSNLLIALNVLMEERNVTGAADRLDLTQSAASRMLGRLRATFDDPLFVRTSRGLTPKKRALDLAGPLQEYLAGLGRVAARAGRFRCCDGAAAISISAIDYVQAVVARAAGCEIRHQAPQIDFEIRQPSTEGERDLDAGVLDFLLMPQQRSVPASSGPLCTTTYTCLVWSRHSVERLTLTRFAAMEHVLVRRANGRAGSLTWFLRKRLGAPGGRASVDLSHRALFANRHDAICDDSGTYSSGAGTHASVEDSRTASRDPRIHNVPGVARNPP